MKTLLTGIFLGGGIAQITGGSLSHQLTVMALIAAIASGSSYWLLCRLAATITNGTGYYRIVYPIPEKVGKNGRMRKLEEAGSSADSTLVGFQ
ncbi:hypothetical protein OB919_20610 [Halobacteria archaeon AArc-curdl1]|uniref:Uncharacterized protein n=1 Tax=Natronosalvus hydrolyticus TaxID=2979988 RepID=A0AAP3E849_9EURY|nr:hypothetical protein [Halobacteria archaeon AArc-curdl1]